MIWLPCSPRPTTMTDVTVDIGRGDIARRCVPFEVRLGFDGVDLLEVRQEFVGDESRAPRVRVVIALVVRVEVLEVLPVRVQHVEDRLRPR